jgi:hypothetical protein
MLHADNATTLLWSKAEKQLYFLLILGFILGFGIFTLQKNKRYRNGPDTLKMVKHDRTMS